MTKKHHPSNRRERLWIKEIKDAKKGKRQPSAATVDYVDTGRLRRKDETDGSGATFEGTADALGEVEVPLSPEAEEIIHLREQLERSPPL